MGQLTYLSLMTKFSWWLSFADFEFYVLLFLTLNSMWHSHIERFFFLTKVYFLFSGQEYQYTHDCQRILFRTSLLKIESFHGFWSLPFFVCESTDESPEKWSAFTQRKTCSVNSTTLFPGSTTQSILPVWGEVHLPRTSVPSVSLCPASYKSTLT